MGSILVMTMNSLNSMISRLLLATALLPILLQAQQQESAEPALPPPDLPAEDAAPLISAEDDAANQQAAELQPPSDTPSTEPQPGTEARTSGSGASVQFQENAQTRPGELPPKVGGEQPPADVNIRRKGDTTIEEYSHNGRVYMVHVVPDNGIPYYVLDADGDGRMESRMNEEHMGPVSPVTYKLFEWD
jgi:hypothetical protein